MSEHLIVSLDIADMKKIESIVEGLEGLVNFYKIGSIPFTFFGPKVVKYLKKRNHRVMLDLKYHDIPNTVARACEGAVELGVDMLTIHTAGGFSMLEETVKACLMTADIKKIEKPKLLGVTLLTSIDEAYFNDLFGNIKRTLKEQVLFLARLAHSAGLDGVVASPKEITAIRSECEKDFLIVTPGIRPLGAESADQARTMTPKQAIMAGADYIIVGRPILLAKDPIEATKKIIREIEDANREIT
jgi:orotidine-5'-phosphate decarboxylase